MAKSLTKTIHIRLSTDKLQLLAKHLPTFNDSMESYSAMLKTITHLINALKFHHREVEVLDLSDISFTLLNALGNNCHDIVLFVTVRDGFKPKKYKLSLVRYKEDNDKGISCLGRLAFNIFSHLNIE